MNEEDDISKSEMLGAVPDFSNSRIDEYELLPSSGFNLVYKVKRRGRWFVLKGLKRYYRDQLLYCELLKKEYEMSSQLDHPNIVKILDYFESDPQLGPCVLMEYVDGTSLSEFLSTKPSFSVRRHVLFQLFDALSYCHSKQIVHRDLKPSNILVTHNGNNVRIIDFGLSDSDNYAVFKQPAGSVRYAAPEQMQPGGKVDCRSDIYALGKLISLIFPNSYKGIASKCSRLEPSKRYSSVEEVMSAIKHRDHLLPVVSSVFGGALLLGGIFYLLIFHPFLSQPLSKILVKHDTVSKMNRDTVNNVMMDTVNNVKIDTVHENPGPGPVTVVKEKADTVFIENASGHKTDTIVRYDYTDENKAYFSAMRNYIKNTFESFDRKLAAHGFSCQEVAISEYYSLCKQVRREIKKKDMKFDPASAESDMFISMSNTYLSDLSLNSWSYLTKYEGHASTLLKEGKMTQKEYDELMKELGGK
jgi:serine/threonine protein kinase